MPDEPVASPELAAGGALTLHVCVTCRAVGDASEERPGARLSRALAEAVARGEGPPGLSVEPVECLSVCMRPCTVAVSAPGRWTYIYGDLDSESSVETILDGLRRYAAAPDGLVPWRERPEAFRKGVVARIPPFRTDGAAGGPRSLGTGPS
jgi:predicted metal-binding protein